MLHDIMCAIYIINLVSSYIDTVYKRYDVCTIFILFRECRSLIPLGRHTAIHHGLRDCWGCLGLYHGQWKCYALYFLHLYASIVC